MINKSTSPGKGFVLFNVYMRKSVGGEGEILAVLDRRGAGSLAEGAQESAPIGITDLYADILNGVLRFGKQVHHMTNADIVEHVGETFVRFFLENAGQEVVRNAKMIGDVVDRNSVLEIFTHESQSVGDEMSGRRNRSCN